MKCILKIKDFFLSSYLDKDEFSSYQDFRNAFQVKVLQNSTIPIGDKISSVIMTDPDKGSYIIPELGNAVANSIDDLIHISLTQTVLEHPELVIEDESTIITPTNESSLSLVDRPPYVYTLSKIYKPSDTPILEGEDEVSFIKNSVVRAVEEIQLLNPDREFFIRMEPDNIDNVHSVDPSTFKKMGVVGVLYEKKAGSFHRVYVKSIGEDPIDRVKLTLDEKDAVKMGWNKSKYITFTIPDFSNPKYSTRRNPVNAEVITEVQRVREKALTEPSPYFKIDGFWQEFPQSKVPIKLTDFLQGRDASVNIASDTDRIFYKGNLFLRIDGEKVPTNRTPLQERKDIIDLITFDYSNDLDTIDDVVSYLNRLLSFKGGDVSFYRKGNKITVYRHSEKVEDRIVRTKSKIVLSNELDSLLEYAKINVDRYTLNNDTFAYSIKEGKVVSENRSPEEWKNFYLNHHTTTSRLINVKDKPYFLSSKSFLFTLESPDSIKLSQAASQIENPKIGNYEISHNEDIPVESFLDDSFINQLEGDVKDAISIVKFLYEQENSRQLLIGKKVKFVADKSRSFKGIINGDKIEINFNLIANPTMIASVFAHEAIHLLTKDWIANNKDHDLVKRLNKLIDLVPDNIKDYYKNPYEILASISNPEISTELKKVKIKDTSLLEKLSDWIKEFFYNLFNASPSDSLYDELINKIVVIATQDSVASKPSKTTTGWTKRKVDTLPLGYDEESLNAFLDDIQRDKSFLNTIVRSIDADLSNFIYTKGLLQEFIGGKLDFITAFGHLYNNYADEEDLLHNKGIEEGKSLISEGRQEFYNILKNYGDFIEEFWIAETEFAKIQKPKKGEVSAPVTLEFLEQDKDISQDLSEREEEEQVIISDSQDITNDKFFERTGMEISSLEGADKISRTFVKMLPAIEKEENITKIYTEEEREIFLQSHPEQLTYFVPFGSNYIKFKTNYLGRLELTDYYNTWNILSIALENSLHIEEMIYKIETNPNIINILPEAIVFAQRLKGDVKNSFQAEVRQKIESAFKRVKVGIYVVLQDDNGFHVVDESTDIFSASKSIVNTAFLNNLTSTLGAFYDQDSGQFNIRKYLISKKVLANQDVIISKVEGPLGDKILEDLGFEFAQQTIWKPDLKTRDENFIEFKKVLITFLSYFDKIDIQIADFITNDAVVDNRIIKGLKSRFKSIMKTNNIHKPILTSTVVKNAEGENQSTLSLFNSILKDKKYYNESRTIDELMYNIPRTKNDMFEFSISKHLMFDQNIRNGNKIYVDTLSGKKQIIRGSKSSGKLTVDLDEGEWFLFNYIMMLKNGIIENTRAETATTCYGFRFDTWNRNFKQTTPFSITDIQNVFKEGKYNIDPSSYVFKVWSNYLKGEIQRISRGGKTFGLFADILSTELKTKLKTISDVDTFQEEVAKSLSSFFDERMKDYNYYFNLMGGKDSLKVLDSRTKELIKTDISEDFNKYGDTRKSWFDLNAMTLHVEETILFQGDISEGWKYFKRAKSVQSTGVPVSTSPQQLKWLNSQLSELSFGKIMYDTLSISNVYKSAVIRDDVIESSYYKDKKLQDGYKRSIELQNEVSKTVIDNKEIDNRVSNLLSAYSKVNVGDGDGFIHPDFYITLLGRTGSLSQDQLLGYKALVLEFKKNAKDFFTKEELSGIDTNLSPEEEKIRIKGLNLIEEGKVIFPKLKFVHRGSMVESSSVVAKEVYDKFALFPLFPSFVRDKKVAKSLFMSMIHEQIGYTKFESGTKISNVGITDFINRIKDGELNVSLDDSSHVLKTEYLAEQIKTSGTLKTKNTFGSQFRKLIQSGLSVVGLDSYVEEWESLNKQFSNIIREEVLKTFGLLATNENVDFSTVDMEKISDFLLNETLQRDYPDNISAFFEKFKRSISENSSTYKYLESSIGNQQMQKLLASLIKKITIQKLNGAQLIQVSSSIFDRTLPNKKDRSRELGFYYMADDQVYASECKINMSGDFLNLLRLPEVKDMTDVRGKEDNILNRTDSLNALLLKDSFVEKYKEHLTVVGYRIPTQGYNSMEVMIVREFLPPFYGPTLVCPPEITAKSGTDYDYDKMSVLVPSIKRNGMIQTEGIDGIQNKMIQVISKILLHPINYSRLITPNTSDYIFSRVKPLLKNLNIQYEEPKNTAIITTRGNFSKFRALKGKNLLGIAAIWNTFTSLTQRHKWELNRSYITNKDDTSTINLALLPDEKREELIKDGKYQIWMPNTADGVSKMEIISQLINVTVDMPTDDTFGQTNFDRSDFGASIYAFAVLGYDYDSILNLWHQPIIYQYKNLVKTSSKRGVKLWKAKLNSIATLLGVEVPTNKWGAEDHGKLKSILFEKGGVLDKFEENIKIKPPSFNIEKVNEIPVTREQQQVLSHYIKLIDQAETFLSIQSSLNFDTSPDSSMIKVNNRDLNRLAAETANLVPESYIEEVRSNSIISSLYTSDILKNVLKSLFPILYSSQNIEVFKQFSVHYPDKEKAYRLLTNDFLLAILQSFGKFPTSIFDKVKPYLHQKSSLKLTHRAKQIKNKLSKEGIDLRLLNILVVNLSKGRNPTLFNQQIFLGFENSPDDKNKITDEFRFLLRREDTMEFAEMLALIGLIQSGWSKSPLYFSDLIPEEFITPIISDALESYTKLTDTQRDKFISKFLDNFEEYEGIALGRKKGLVESFRLMDYTRNIDEIYTEYEDLGEVETQDVTYEEVGPLQLESGNVEEKGKLQMQPDNVSKILSGEKTITNRTEKLDNGIYELPNGVQVELEYIGEWKVFDDGTPRIYQLDASGAKLKSMLKDDFAKAEGFKDWIDFEQNNKFSKNFINGNQSRYVYSVKPLEKVQQSNKIRFQEDQSSGYAERTRKNASADATIAIAFGLTGKMLAKSSQELRNLRNQNPKDLNIPSAGEKLTYDSVKGQNKLYYSINLTANELDVNPQIVDGLVSELKLAKVKSLNIAGNGIYTLRDKYSQEQIDQFTYDLLKAVTDQYPIQSIRTGGQTGFDEAGAKAGMRLGIPTLILAPKGWTFRDITGKDISHETLFKSRFNVHTDQKGQICLPF